MVLAVFKDSSAMTLFGLVTSQLLELALDKPQKKLDHLSLLLLSMVFAEWPFKVFQLDMNHHFSHI